MNGKFKLFGILLFFAGLAMAGNGLYILIAKPESANFYFYTRGVVTEKYKEPKCTGAAGLEKCKESLFVRYRYRSQSGDSFENATEAFCIDWENTTVGSQLYVAHVKENPKSAKACDHPIVDPHYARPWVYLFFAAIFVCAGLGMWRQRANPQ